MPARHVDEIVLAALALEIVPHLLGRGLTDINPALRVNTDRGSASEALIVILLHGEIRRFQKQPGQRAHDRVAFLPVQADRPGLYPDRGHEAVGTLFDNFKVLFGAQIRRDSKESSNGAEQPVWCSLPIGYA